MSKDIDLFFESAAALRLLSPNRNLDTKRITDRWQEPGHYLKFEVAGIGDIDILVTRTWLEPPSVWTTVSGTPMAVQRPAEIIARKIAYRLRASSCAISSASPPWPDATLSRLAKSRA